jgi:hypothetical protein
MSEPQPPSPEPDHGGPGWARAELAREVARARDPLVAGSAPKSTADLSDAWRLLERRVRGSMQAPEATAGGPGWRRPVSRAMLRLLRPLIRRNEALIAELAAYGGALAERLEEAEAELARLRHRLGSADEPGTDPPKPDTDPS